MTFPVRHCIGEIKRFSPIDWKCVLRRLYNVFMNEQHWFMNLRFWVHLVCLEKLSSPSVVGVRNSLSNFVPCNFFRICLLGASFSVALVVKCAGGFWNFKAFISSVHLSKLVHTQPGCETRVWCTRFFSLPYYCTLEWNGTHVMQC